MAVIAFVNVGTRDVLLDDRRLEQVARAEGKQILETYDEVAHRLSFPIIQPQLEQILRRESFIDKLIFLGTDQEDTTPQKKDTIYFAKVMQRFVLTRYEQQVGQVDVVSIQKINLALYDEAITFFQKTLSEYTLLEEDVVYLLPTSGTPACSMALLLQGIMLFGERCQVLYQQQRLKREEVWMLPVGAQFQAAFQRQTAVYLLQRFDFYAAQHLFAAMDGVDSLVFHLLSYATTRLWFEFETASQHLQEAIAKATGRQRDALRRMQADLAALNNQEPRALLAELFHNARIAWENGRLLDFLARLIRFQQVALPLVIDKMPPDMWPSPVDKASLEQEGMRQMVLGLMRQSVQEEVERLFTLPSAQRETFLKQMEVSFNLAEIQRLCFDLHIDYENVAASTKQKTLINLIRYCERRRWLLILLRKVKRERQSGDWESFKVNEPDAPLSQLVRSLIRLERLRPLHQQSILAIGFRGITKQAIMEVYQVAAKADNDSQVQTSPLQDMVTVCTVLEVSTENPFRQVCEIIIDKLG